MQNLYLEMQRKWSEYFLIYKRNKFWCFSSNNNILHYRLKNDCDPYDTGVVT